MTQVRDGGPGGAKPDIVFFLFQFCVHLIPKVLDLTHLYEMVTVACSKISEDSRHSRGRQGKDQKANFIEIKL